MEAFCGFHLLRHLSRVEEEWRHSPVALEREVREQRDEIATGVWRAECSPRSRGHDSGILSHRFSSKLRNVLEAMVH